MQICSGGEPYGGERGCGLYFCSKHLFISCTRVKRRVLPQLCSQCVDRRRKPFQPTPDTLKWLYHKMTDPSWAEWRAENGLPSSGEIQPCCGKAHPMNINGQDIADHKPMEEV